MWVSRWFWCVSGVLHHSRDCWSLITITVKGKLQERKVRSLLLLRLLPSSAEKNTDPIWCLYLLSQGASFFSWFWICHFIIILLTLTRKRKFSLTHQFTLEPLDTLAPFSVIHSTEMNCLYALKLLNSNFSFRTHSKADHWLNNIIKSNRRRRINWSSSSKRPDQTFYQNTLPSSPLVCHHHHHHQVTSFRSCRLTTKRCGHHLHRPLHTHHTLRSSSQSGHLTD